MVLLPVLANIKLYTGAADLLMGLITTRKVYNGSKSAFSYTLLAFVYANGINALCYWACLFYPR